MGPARFPNGLEVRAAVELRAIPGRRLEGYAARFDVEACIGEVREVIRPGAFLSTLANPAHDILALVDHEPGALLGRTSSGTLKLAEDSRGLHFEIAVPDTQLGRDVLAQAERNDLGGCSFGFRPIEVRWPKADFRELLGVDLVEISVVRAFPAYSQTSVVARSLPPRISDLQRRRLVGIM